METIAEHGPEATEVINRELAACILGQRNHADRLELRVDTVGKMLAYAEHHRTAMRNLLRSIALGAR